MNTTYERQPRVSEKGKRTNRHFEHSLSNCRTWYLARTNNVTSKLYTITEQQTETTTATTGKRKKKKQRKKKPRVTNSIWTLLTRKRQQNWCLNMSDKKKESHRKKCYKPFQTCAKGRIREAKPGTEPESRMNIVYNWHSGKTYQ